MNVIVTGGRHYHDWETVATVLDIIGPSRVIHGDASGADKLAGRWAATVGRPQSVYPADWEHHGKKAGPMRNQNMVDNASADLVVAFPGGPGTQDCVSRAVKAGLTVIRVERGHNRPDGTTQ